MSDFLCKLAKGKFWSNRNFRVTESMSQSGIEVCCVFFVLEKKYVGVQCICVPYLAFHSPRLPGLAKCVQSFHT